MVWYLCTYVHYVPESMRCWVLHGQPVLVHVHPHCACAPPLHVTEIMRYRVLYDGNV